MNNIKLKKHIIQISTMVLGLICSPGFALANTGVSTNDNTCPQYCVDTINSYEQPVGAWYRTLSSEDGLCQVMYIKDGQLWRDMMAGEEDPMPDEVKVKEENGTLRMTLHGDLHALSIEYFEIDSVGNWLNKNTESNGEALLTVPPCMTPQIEKIKTFIQE